MPRIVAFGEVLWDLLPTGPVLGGAPCNLAFRLRELGHEVRLASAVGDDVLGRSALARMKELGMDTSLVQCGRHPTGTVNISFDAASQPDYVINPDVAYDHVEPAAELIDAAQRADCLCFGTLAQRTDRSRETLRTMLDAAGTRQGLLRFLDVNLRRDCYSPQVLSSSLAACDIVKLNDGELAIMAGMFGFDRDDAIGSARTVCRKWAIEHCLLTLGERGAACISRDGMVAYEPGHRVPVADPCGAGDAFAAGFIHRYLEGRPVPRCLELGNAMGALVATHTGATSAIDPAAVDRLLGGSGAPRIVDPYFQGRGNRPQGAES